MGKVDRFTRSRELISYLGLNPSEASSGERRRLGSISKQGNSFMRWLASATGLRVVQITLDRSVVLIEG